MLSQVAYLWGREGDFQRLFTMPVGLYYFNIINADRYTLWCLLVVGFTICASMGAAIAV